MLHETGLTGAAVGGPQVSVVSLLSTLAPVASLLVASHWIGNGEYFLLLLQRCDEIC